MKQRAATSRRSKIIDSVEETFFYPHDGNFSFDRKEKATLPTYLLEIYSKNFSFLQVSISWAREKKEEKKRKSLTIFEKKTFVVCGRILFSTLVRRIGK